MKRNNNLPWISMENVMPPEGRTVIVYSDVFDRYSFASDTPDGWDDGGIPAVSHWMDVPKPPWWCFGCMGIPESQWPIQTAKDSSICVSCGRDIEKELMDFERK